MHKDLKRAEEILRLEGRALVLVRRGETVLKDDRRGIGPIYEIATDKRDLAEGASLADKVIGKAAAMLAVDAGIERLYAAVLSEEAAEVLRWGGIPFEKERLVPFIKNRDKTGRCPMEKLAEGLAYGEVEILKACIAGFLESLKQR